jgi:hypothetical protein
VILEPDQIRELTKATTRAKQREVLAALGIKFGVRPDTTLVVLEKEVDRALCGSTGESKVPNAGPNWE